MVGLAYRVAALLLTAGAARALVRHGADARGAAHAAAVAGAGTALHLVNASAQLRATNATSLAGTAVQITCCNGHPAGSLHVSVGKGQMSLTGGNPIPSGQCRKFVNALRIADFVELKVGETDTGVFMPSEPPDGASVLLVVYENEPNQLDVKMQQFRNLKYPQVIAMDVATGASRDTQVRLVPRQGQEYNENKDINYSEIGPIDPGLYTVQLLNKEGKVITEKELDASMGEKYVILRNGESKIVVTPGPGALPKSLATGGPTLAFGAAAAWALLAL